MELAERVIDCTKISGYSNSNRKTIFRIAVFTFDYNIDKRIIDKLNEKGKEKLLLISYVICLLYDV